MGSALTTFSKEWKYQLFEGGLFAGVTLIAVIILVVVCSLKCCWQRCKTCASSRKCAPTNWNDCKKELHTFLMSLFPNMIAKKVYAQKMDIKTSDKDGFVFVDKVNKQIAIEMDENTDEKEVYLFGGKEFNHDSTKGRLPCLPSCFFHCYTYYYFILVVVLAGFWFVIMTIENAIYRKTTTCNDINVQDNSFTCYDVTKSDLGSHTPATCTIGAQSLNIEVFCYLFQPNIAAFGIAFSTFNLILFAVRVYFKIAIKLAESNCGMYSMIVVQSILTLLSLFGLPSILPSVHFATTIDLYFFRGSGIMRWAIFLFLIFTTVLVIPVPWCGFTHKQTYEDMVIERKATIPRTKTRPQAKTWPPVLPTSHRQRANTSHRQRAKSVNGSPTNTSPLAPLDVVLTTREPTEASQPPGQQ